MPPAAARIAWFGAVGLLATAVHYAVVVGLVRGVDWHPLPANVAGWLAAFACSFTGHFFKTFRDPALDAAVALRRFFAIALLGFAANQALYALALRFTPLRYDIAVIAVSLCVAVMTYLLSRHWGFKSAQPAGKGTAQPGAARAATCALLIAHAVAICAVALNEWRHPMGNWDIVPYTALLHQRDGMDPQVLSRQTYEDVRAYVGEATYQRSVAGGATSSAYLTRVHEDPAALVDNLRFYAIKPLYIALSRLAFQFTGNAASAATLVSALAMAALLAALPWYFRRPMLAVAAVWALLVLGQPAILKIAGCTTPDTLGMLMVGACVLATLARRHWAVSGGLGLLAVLARPDAAIVVVPWLAGVGWLWRRERPALAHYLCAATCFALFVGLGKAALPWSTLFWHTFIQREAFPSAIEFAITPQDYLAVMRRTLHTMLEPRPLIFLIGGAALALVPWLRHRRIDAPQWLAAVAVGGMVMQYLIFPVDEFGRERLFLAHYVMVLMAGLLTADGVARQRLERPL